MIPSFTVLVRPKIIGELRVDIPYLDNDSDAKDVCLLFIVNIATRNTRLIFWFG